LRQSLKSPSADGETLFLIFALRKSTEIKNKSASADAQFSGKTVLSDGLSFLFVLIETRVGHRVSKGDFARCGERLRATVPAC